MQLTNSYQVHCIPEGYVKASMRHLTHYTKAMAFIESHGHFAAITKDGLLAMSVEITEDTQRPRYDAHYEAPHLFEVDEDGMVSSRLVREWLGY